MKIKVIASLLLLLSAVAALFYYALWTPAGGRVVFKQSFLSYLNEGDVKIGEANGAIVNGITLNNIELTEIKHFPKGTKLKIQQLFVQIDPQDMARTNVEIINGRLRFPDSEPIVFAGRLDEQKLDFNIYSSGFALREITAYFPGLAKFIPLEAEVTGVDLYIKGDPSEAKVTGEFKLDQLVFEGFIFSNSSSGLDLQVKNVFADMQWFGRVFFSGGTVQAKKTFITVNEGDIKFLGAQKMPEFNFSGKTKIQKTKINIELKGALDDPQISLSSDPPFSREKLMIMLATGKGWQSIEEGADTKTFASDLTRDFIDYFFFADKKNRFAQKFGLYDVSVTLNKDDAGIEARKDITNKIDVGYGIEQKTGADTTKTTVQKIQGEYQMTDKVSLGVEKEMKKTNALDEVNASLETSQEDKVYLKYKTKF